jgi:predicted RNA methylase
MPHSQGIFFPLLDQSEAAMSQRNSGYARRPDEDYPTPDWVAAIIARYLQERNVRMIWDPAAGNGQFAEALKTGGLCVIATGDDFFAYKKLPQSIDGICSNPPYGDDRKGTLACNFIRHALELAPVVGRCCSESILIPL